ncbi:actin-like [Orycteropus afer afer]|uniref:Actin-like n=1 Tax=Orycteropus afer afer TaxID=1230840 RepID=A0A8B7AHP3_ORYAF|nr:actin-like [Orycteropus afer afer]
MVDTPLVCDFGSGVSKVGFAGMEAPLVVFPTVLGKLRHDNVLVGMEEKDWFIGAETQTNPGKLVLQRPISRATVTNWDHMEKVWHHAFYQMLRVAPEHHPLLLTEPPLTPSAHRERVSEIMFETFNVPALYLANQGVLSLYASGRTTGTTIESGEGMTYFVPITDGCPLHQSTMQLDVAGQDLTLHFLQLLTNSGHQFVSSADQECARDVKEKSCYVALDFEKELAKAESPAFKRTYQLPDGQELDIGKERFVCPEALFNTGLIGRTSQGVHMVASRSIFSCDPALRKSLFGNILLSGGTGCCSGLRSRLQREVAAVVSPTIVVKLYVLRYETEKQGESDGLEIPVPVMAAVAPFLLPSCRQCGLTHELNHHIVGPVGLLVLRGVSANAWRPLVERNETPGPASSPRLSESGRSADALQHRRTRRVHGQTGGAVGREWSVCVPPGSCWVGGSILCSLSTFKDMWVTKDEYGHIGSSIVSRKSF